MKVHEKNGGGGDKNQMDVPVPLIKANMDYLITLGLKKNLYIFSLNLTLKHIQLQNFCK